MIHVKVDTHSPCVLLVSGVNHWNLAFVMMRDALVCVQVVVILTYQVRSQLVYVLYDVHSDHVTNTLRMQELCSQGWSLFSSAPQFDLAGKNTSTGMVAMILCSAYMVRSRSSHDMQDDHVQQRTLETCGPWNNRFGMNAVRGLGVSTSLLA
jgi:hypothetical protein